MIVNAHSKDWDPATDRYHVFVDGKRVTGTWYFDTDEGVAKSFHIFQNATDEEISKSIRVVRQLYPKHDWDIARLRTEKFAGDSFTRQDFPPEWEMQRVGSLGPISRTFRGVVTVVPFNAASVGNTNGTV